VEHVKKDIDSVHKYVQILGQIADESGRISQTELSQMAARVDPGDVLVLNAALRWFAGVIPFDQAHGMTSVFLQDANSLVIKPPDLVEILKHLRARFPWVTRVTSYARSHTLARIKDSDLAALREAGLSRIHTGLESGSDRVLEMVQKGATKEVHVKAGRKVKNAGIELSEYYMPGLGGRALTQEHALETAAALNQINPDFIRLRTLAIPDQAPLAEAYRAGRFEKCTDVMVAQEVLTFIEHLEGITSVLKSDHILNPFADLEGTLPQDKARMTTLLRAFLDMPPQRQRLYQVGRRLGIFGSLSDMRDPHRLAAAERACRELGITPDNADAIIDQLMKRFI
jgi:hypothetical protein